MVIWGYLPVRNTESFALPFSFILCFYFLGNQTASDDDSSEDEWLDHRFLGVEGARRGAVLLGWNFSRVLYAGSEFHKWLSFQIFVLNPLETP